MSNNKKEHFWIPDEEIKRVDKTPTARTQPRKRDFSEHGKKLKASLQTIKKTVDAVRALGHKCVILLAI